MEDILNIAYTGSQRIIADMTIGILNSGIKTNQPTDSPVAAVTLRISSVPIKIAPTRYRAMRSVKPRLERKPYIDR